MTGSVAIPERGFVPYVTVGEDGYRLRPRGRDGVAVAVLVFPDRVKYLAWHAFFPVGLDKAPINRYQTSYRLFFLVDGMPEGAETSIVDRGVTLFLSGYGLPIPVDEWIGTLPDKLPIIPYTDVRRMMGKTAEVQA